MTGPQDPPVVAYRQICEDLIDDVAAWAQWLNNQDHYVWGHQVVGPLWDIVRAAQKRLGEV